MTYSESARGVMIGRRRAIRECLDHGESFADYCEHKYPNLAEPLPHDFDAGELLDWLGY